MRPQIFTEGMTIIAETAITEGLVIIGVISKPITGIREYRTARFYGHRIIIIPLNLNKVLGKIKNPLDLPLGLVETDIAVTHITLAGFATVRTDSIPQLFKWLHNVSLFIPTFVTPYLEKIHIDMLNLAKMNPGVTSMILAQDEDIAVD